MRETDPLQYLFLIVGVLSKIWKRINLKKALATKGQPFFDDLDSAILTFFRDYFNAVGDYVLYSYILEPEDPKREAEMIINKLKEDYENLLNATKNLVLFFIAHKEELKGLLKPKDWLLLEEIMVAFEGDKPNWDFLYQVAKSVEVTQNEKQIEFEITLNRLLEEFNRETGQTGLWRGS
ncbi:hypothetical protein [Thermococcus sp.]